MIVLNDEASAKFHKRWQGPATMLCVKSPYIYLVDMVNGCMRHVHANKMRKFNVRVQGCNVICDSDTDFGCVLVPDVELCDILLSMMVDQSRVVHLDEEQRVEFALLNGLQACFGDYPGLCKVTEHQIRVTDEFVPKQMWPYRVPEAMKPV